MTKKKQQPEEPESKCTISTTETVQLHIPVSYASLTPRALVNPTTSDLGDFLYAVWTKFGHFEYEVNVSPSGLTCVNVTEQ